MGFDLDLPLGKEVKSPSFYAPEILASVPRNLSREKSKINPELFQLGLDRWTAYEFVWRDAADKLHPGILNIDVDCRSDNIVESKSLKLYLNSVYFTQFTDAGKVEEEIRGNLSRCVSGEVRVTFARLDAAEKSLQRVVPEGDCLDDIDLEESAELATEQGGYTEEKLFSHVFRSLCPVTSQPDWATILIQYRGAQLVRTNLLGYLRSYSGHQGFHENCVEQIFSDIYALTEIDDIAVCAKFLRRGGIDICPFRSSTRDFVEPTGYLARQ